MNEQNEKTGKGRKVLKIVAAVLGGLIALYCLAYVGIVMATGDPLPMPLGVGTAVVLTGSMEPEIHANDLIFVAKMPSYAIGDIVVYSTGGTPTVHRIIGIDDESGTLITKGDANNTADPAIPFSKVKGKMVFRIPYIGIVPRFVRTIPGMIVTLVLLFTLLFLTVKSKAQNEEENKKTETMLREIARLKKETGATDEDISKVDLRTDTEKEIEKLKKLLGEDDEGGGEDRS